jgi:hypothetical protein
LRHLELENALSLILKQYPEGKSEYELFRLLQARPYQIFDKNCLSEPLLMFQSHFVLFHSLYQLRATYLSEQVADIRIHPSNIRLWPYHNNKPGMTEPDKLQGYYLDWNNFSDTTEGDVEKLLQSFWKAMQGQQSMPDRESIKAAYAYFELAADSDFRQVKTAYHKYQHLHHPDKGGDKQKSQQIEANFQRLKAYLR